MAPPKVKQPRYNVLSLRVSDAEYDAIYAIVKARGSSVSKVMGEALTVYIKKEGV